MADLSESYEAAMLQSLKEAALNSDEESNVTPRAEGHAKGLSRSKLHYGNDDQDSSNDTSMSTLKSPVSS
jgi:hypothetical protein